MKKSLLMLISMLLVTTILVAVAGAYLKSVILEPLQLYQEESILSVPFLLMADDAAQYILKAAIDTVPATENETVETIESARPPQQTEEPNVSPTVLPTEEPPTQPPTEPVVITESWFDDVLFIGDSRTFGMSCNHRLGKADYFSKGSMSTFSALGWTVTDNRFYDKSLAFVLANFTYGKIFIHLGLNECGYDHKLVIEAYQDVIDLIREHQPDAAIIIQSVMTVSRMKATDEQFSLARINNLNHMLFELAMENGLYYQDTNEFAADEEGYLREDISNDGCHPHNFGYDEWAEFILENASELGIP